METRVASDKAVHVADTQKRQMQKIECRSFAALRMTNGRAGMNGDGGYGGRMQVCAREIEVGGGPISG
jgi:hypothetical protein